MLGYASSGGLSLSFFTTLAAVRLKLYKVFVTQKRYENPTCSKSAPASEYRKRKRLASGEQAVGTTHVRTPDTTTSIEWFVAESGLSFVCTGFWTRGRGPWHFCRAAVRRRLSSLSFLLHFYATDGEFQ
jgi:hypothetical protein